MRCFSAISASSVKFNFIRLLLDYELQKFSPSEIAVGIIVAARKNSGISPIWTPQLDYLTTFEYSQIKEVSEMITKYFHIFSNFLEILRRIVYNK